MKTHFAYISFIVIFTLSMGWLVSSYSSKSISKSDTIKLLKQEVVSLRNLNNQPELIYKTLHIAYPNVPEHKMRHYSLMINDYASQFNLSWSLIAATIWIESQFDPTLKSPQNAKGLMQLLENTALDQALKTGIKYYEDKTVWDDIT
ncbi:MAG: transglycosylase SLT domain-containing protein, partial [Candidatus Margulisiibacteriota bacterium]